MRSRRAALLTILGALTAGCGGGAAAPTTPTTTPSTAGTVYRQATVQLVQTFALDLDTGTFPPGLGGGADIWFNALTDQQRFLMPMTQSGATVTLYGASAPGYSGCATVPVGLAPIPIDSLTAGVYVCATTSQGRIAVVRVDEPAGPSSATAALTISYTTYDK